MGEYVLTVEALTKRYGNKKALNGLTLNLPKGRIIGLLGPNGSGKTTLLKLIAGLLTPDTGTITVCGKTIGTETKALISYLPDRPCFGKHQKVRDLLDLFHDFYADFDRSRAETMLRSLDIAPGAKLQTLSKGNREKVQLILAMSRRAKLYLLDEPIGGVDPAARDYILNTIITNFDPEATILISTHLIADVEPVLDSFLFLHDGHLLRHGSTDQVREEVGKSLDELFREVFQCLPNS